MPILSSDIIELALAEDIGSGDITAALIPENQESEARIISQQKAVICGIDFVNAIYQHLDPKVVISWKVKDGDEIESNQVLGILKGNSRVLLTGERTALNFLQTLSSTATLTRRFVAQLRGTKAQLLDTRKTLPGLRLAQKYAVRCGGGKNHRLGLYDAFLIKENHISACGSITKAVLEARRTSYPVEVEVKNLSELQEAIAVHADIVMLDNFSLKQVQAAVELNAKSVKVEVSGGVNLDNIRAVAETGVDYISVGALTKTVVPIELSFLISPGSEVY